MGEGARERGDNIRISFWDIFFGYICHNIIWIKPDTTRYSS
jgi:hypothetical protein